MKDYPMWKKILWRFARIFIPAFITMVGVGLTSATTDNIGTKDFWLNIVFVPAIVAGVSALGKWLREISGEDYDRLAHSLPF